MMGETLFESTWVVHTLYVLRRALALSKTRYNCG